MASFFEKLKKGMGIDLEEGIEETEKEIEKEKKETEIDKSLTDQKVKKIEIEETKTKEEKNENPTKEVSTESEERNKWPDQEGQLAIDVYQTETNLVIQSAIAGVKIEDLDISIERDILTIKGERKKPLEESGDYFIQECYWGPFSRRLVMPVEVDPDRAEATMRNGILIIQLPKLLKEKKRTIQVKI